MRLPAAARVLALVFPFATPAGAQPVAAGRGTVAQTVQVGLIVPDILRLRRTADAEVIATRGDTVQLRLQVEVAANQRWSLRAQPGVPADAGEFAELRVLDHEGRWRALRPGGPPAIVVEDYGPCNFTPFVLELQLVGVRRLELLRALTLELLPTR